MVADGSAARYYEMATWDVRKRDAGQDSAISAANQFMDPTWGMLEFPSPAAWYSSLREGNLLRLAKSKTNGTDQQHMMSILDVPLYNEDGSLGKGAAVLKKNPKNDWFVFNDGLYVDVAPKVGENIPPGTQVNATLDNRVLMDMLAVGHKWQTPISYIYARRIFECDKAISK